MPIYEQVQNVRSECLLWHHLLHPCEGSCQACRVRLHLLCLLFHYSTCPCSLVPDSVIRDDSMIGRTGDPTNEQSSQSVSQQPFLGILGGKTSRNDQRFTLAKVNLCPLVVKLQSIGYSVYIYIFIYIFSYIYIHIHIYIYSYIHIYIYSYIHIYEYIYI